ncbi:hypothetical protein MVEN_01411100 [Mycena venus]|uniref:Uncharacterized protein n=1 Tax=Mycena venus TaxID=2733690 RepID=A0A8H6XWL9_9AGAR|nr:hypothetical protein MVEN_01411100 [Mycena venus]
MQGITATSLIGSYDPPAGTEDDYADASDAGEQFLQAMSGVKNSRKLGFISRVTEACMPVLDEEGIKRAARNEVLTSFFLAIENKVQQYSQAVTSDPDLKDKKIPKSVDLFLKAVDRVRQLRRGPRVTASTATVNEVPAAKKPVSESQPVSKGTRRAKAASIGPEDIDSAGEDELSGEDVDMAEAPPIHKAKAKQADPPTDVESEDSEKSKPAKKKLEPLRFSKKTSESKTTPASSSKPGKAPVKAQESDRFLSYNEVEKVMREAGKRIGITATIPHTIEGVQRMDCALRTNLSEIAIRISMETKKYDAVHGEYERLRSIMDEHKIESRDNFIFEELTEPSAPLPLRVPTGPRGGYYRGRGGRGRGGRFRGF